MSDKEIRVLDKKTADRIAAGEVIDRPASIVKELVENSLDAGSSIITCEIRKGGKEYIRVTDNGEGIPKDQIITAFKRHATSKINKADDLLSIRTLGFRGEALASIAAVSRVEMITKTVDSALGRRVIIHGGEVVEESSVGCPDGTTIIASDLFYNTPARRKFLKNDGAESGIIIDLMERLAVTGPDISFRLINNDKTVFSTHGDGKLLNTILSVYKDREYRDLVEVGPYENDDIKIYGYISRPQVSRSNRRSQFFFVNGRVIKSDILEKALMSGYKERLFDGRYPIAFLFIEVNPEKIDVNIHPNKREIRFNDELRIVNEIREAVVNTLNKDAAVSRLDDSVKISSDITQKTPIAPVKNSENIDFGSEGDKRAVYYADENQEGYRGYRVNEQEVIDIKHLFETKREEKENQAVVYDNLNYDNTIASKPFNFDDLNFGDPIFDTYITATDRDGFYLFDQHACHERINYERFMELYEAQDKPRQMLILPFTLDVPGGLAENDSEWLNELEKIGYLVEKFGDNTYIVREVPQFLTIGEAEDFIKEFTDAYYEGGSIASPDMERLIGRACKSSVKAYDHLTEEEIEYMMQELKTCRNPFSCPHGRPTFIRFSLRDIEKMFKRIV